MKAVIVLFALFPGQGKIRFCATIFLDTRGFSGTYSLSMPTEMIKVQVTIPRLLAQALSLAAKNDRRSRPRFMANLLEDSPLVKEALRSLSLPTSSGVSASLSKAAPPVPRETPEAFFARLTPEQKAKRAAHGLPTECSPPENAPDQSYDCPPVETMEEFQEKLRKGEIKLDQPPEESDYLKMLRAQGQIDTN